VKFVSRDVPTTGETEIDPADGTLLTWNDVSTELEPSIPVAVSTTRYDADGTRELPLIIKFVSVARD
jgi:hypothetical protein